jgi:hypothetical protein
LDIGSLIETISKELFAVDDSLKIGDNPTNITDKPLAM